ncbi:DNA polymerase III subunit alpha [Cytobacillus sp. FJAT-54145]|uniref:DNA-directed DNA polymerase n=1 Tax=Cytobacillus spartinae TaxID=3299023 RepID=A0ABW6KB96_9BACI
MDFEPERRHEVIQYVQEKYGHDHVAQIITFGTLGAKSVFRDVGRTLGLSFSETDYLSKEIPKDADKWYKVLDLPAIAEKAQEDDRVKQLLEIGEILFELPRHTSVHAAGVVIGRQPLQTYVPLKEEDGVMITMWDMGELETAGLLKMDFLGLKTLSVEKKTFENIEKTTGIKMSHADIPTFDQKTFELLSEAKSGSVFQVESGGMKRYLKEMKPSCFEDIVALLALYRPGPMENIPTYIENKRNGDFEVLHPLMKPILQSTNGVLVYQEQIQRLAQVLCGYSLGEADVLRRAVGKKKKEIIAKERDKFVPRAVANGIDQKVADDVYDLIVKFANYGFNKSHAAAYGVITWDTAYLKANFLEEFMAANLTVAIGEAEKMSMILSDCKRLGVTILPPSLKSSKADFSVEFLPTGEKAIRYGLNGIRNVGKSLAEAIEEAPDFATLEEYLLHIPTHTYNSKQWQHLIWAGACDELGSRGTLLASLDGLLLLAKEREELKKRGQLSFFDLGIIPPMELPFAADPSKMTILKEEKRVLEVALSGHPLEACRDLVEPHVQFSISELDESVKGQFQTLAGVFGDIKKIVTKKGNPMAFASLEDETSDVEAVIFPKVYEEAKANIKPFVPILVRGKVEWDEKEERAKLLVDSIRPVLEGRQVLYIQVQNKNHQKTLTHTLSSQNGITEVMFVNPATRSIEKADVSVRMNKNTLNLLQQETYEFISH